MGVGLAEAVVEWLCWGGWKELREGVLRISLGAVWRILKSGFYLQFITIYPIFADDRFFGV